VTGEKTRITILKSTRAQVGDCGRPGETIDDILIKLVECYKKYGDVLQPKKAIIDKTKPARRAR
jgi:hypothetical protein